MKLADLRKIFASPEGEAEDVPHGSGKSAKTRAIEDYREELRKQRDDLVSNRESLRNLGGIFEFREYTLGADGTDAILKIGKHKGLEVSEIAKIDPSYLVWLAQSDFPPALKEIVQYQLDLKAIE